LHCYIENSDYTISHDFLKFDISSLSDISINYRYTSPYHVKKTET